MPKHEVATCLKLGCAAYDKLAERIKELEAALCDYGVHKNSCAYIQGLRGQSIEKCDCGFSQTLKGQKI